MSALAIFAQLKAAGVRVSRRGDDLLAQPKAAVTESNEKKNTGPDKKVSQAINEQTGTPVDADLWQV